MIKIEIGEESEVPTFSSIPAR